uniref:Uncharacterized protein n=2 Tax=Chrysotila carterae TaxID=13221 RepID=A0A6S9WFC8_CHRCT
MSAASAQAHGTSLPNTLSTLVSRGGLGSLYRGFSPAMAEHALNRGILFGLGSVIKKKLPESWAEPVRDAASGGGAALFKTVMLHPADTIKCRWQLGQPRSELGGLYQGFGPAAMRSSVGMAIWLSVRNALERALQPSDPAEGPLISYRQFISGATASVVTDLCTFPLDTLKKNLQAAPSSARLTMSEMVTRLFADGGLRRFYVGYTPRLVMVSINGALFNVSLVVSKWLLGPIFPE